jgi:hypothetical protein
MKHRQIILETAASTDLPGWLITDPGESLNSEFLQSTTQLARTLCEGSPPCQAQGFAAQGFAASGGLSCWLTAQPSVSRASPSGI